MITRFIIICLCVANALTAYSYDNFISFCEKAGREEEVFAGFKKDPVYTEYCENVEFEYGKEYLDYITTFYPDLVDRFDDCRSIDGIGNPEVYDYGIYGFFSPNTLRAIKIAGDLRYEFGDLSGMDIVEIGRGHGCLCAVIAKLLGFNSYTLIDHSKCSTLTKKNLLRLGIKKVQFYSIMQPPKEKEYDLVISNFYFSEMDRNLQKMLIEDLFISCHNGYLTNSYITKNSYSPDELLSSLMRQGKKGRIETEMPLTSSDNLLYLWKGKKTPIIPAKLQPGIGVTYLLSGGRLGDNLISLLHAKWISYKHGIPLYINPFSHSDYFYFSLLNPGLSLTTPTHFKNEITISIEDDFVETEVPTLFNVPYFAEYKSDKKIPGYSVLKRFIVDWDDEGFKKEIVQSLTPFIFLDLPDLPTGCKTVAVHVRRGGGYDPGYINQVFAEKFPPDSYFIAQIKRLARFYQGQKLYVYIFTDDPNPQEIASLYERAIENPNITFDCRNEDNNYWSNVLEDMMAMIKFDCLIRGESNFAIIPELIGNHEIVINASKITWQDGQQVVNQIELMFK